MLHARLQRRLQPRQRGLALLLQLAAQQRERFGAALQFGLPALCLGKLARHGLPLFFQALRPGQCKGAAADFVKEIIRTTCMPVCRPSSRG